MLLSPHAACAILTELEVPILPSLQIQTLKRMDGLRQQSVIQSSYGSQYTKVVTVRNFSQQSSCTEPENIFRVGPEYHTDYSKKFKNTVSPFGRNLRIISSTKSVDNFLKYDIPITNRPRDRQTDKAIGSKAQTFMRR